MYTELVIACSIHEKHKNYIDALNNMVNDICCDIPCDVKFDHPLFNTARWDWMFHGDSYYFTGKTHSEFIYDDISKNWVLTARFNIKNYNNEIEKFLDWIAPVANEKDEFVGYKRYEEAENPTLIYFEDDKVRYA